jgi:hypothetical protein
MSDFQESAEVSNAPDFGGAFVKWFIVLLSVLLGGVP